MTMFENWALKDKSSDLENSILNLTAIQDIPVGKTPKIALISSNSERCQLILESLGTFQNYFNPETFIHLGNLRKNDVSFNIQFIKELKQSNIVPIILDQGFPWFSGIISGLNGNKNTISPLCVSNRVHFSEYGIPCDYLAFQRHLVKKSYLDRIADHSIDSMSLGKLRAESDQLEPILQNSDHVYFDLSSIRASDLPGSFNSMPSGLTSEESCQIMKYLGQSNGVLSLTIGGDLKICNTSANAIAQLIWYFVEGATNRKELFPTKEHQQEYLIDSESYDNCFKFVQSKENGRWWFQVDENEQGIPKYIPCSELEFMNAKDDNMPTRLFRHFVQA